VPINKIPADEKVEPRERPLTAAMLDGKEDVALHLLSLAGSEEKLDLGESFRSRQHLAALRCVEGPNTASQHATSSWGAGGHRNG